MLVYLADIMMSYMHTSSHISSLDLTIGVSNYTVTYRHLERIDFWDTCIFSMTEDMRIVSKSYWKTNGQIKTVPIITPFNQMSVSTGQGWMADLNARFTQAIRHALGQVEVSYNIVSFLKSSRTLRDFYALWLVFDLYFCFLVIPLPIICSFLQHVLHLLPHSELDDGSFFNMFGIVSTLLFMLAFPFYQALKRQATSQIYGLENTSAWNLALLPLAVTVIGLVFGFVPMVMGGFKLVSGTEFVHHVAPKLNVKPKESGSLFFPSSLDPE